MRSRTPPRLLPLLCSLLALAFATVPGRAGELPTDGKEKFDKTFQKNKGTIIDLLNGKEPDPSKQPEAMDTLAKYHVYRYTWLESREPNKAATLYNQFTNDVATLVRNKPATLKTIDEFGKQVALLSEDMLTNSEPLARVNYMRVLARLAQEGAEDVVDPILKALQDPEQLDGVKYWALEGLREWFARGHVVNPQPPKNKKRETDAILALIAFIEQKPPAGLSLMPPEEVEGVRVLRREAIKALALTRYPAVVNGNKELVGRTAQLLMKVIVKEGFTPEVKYDEQIEAAIGLCRMQIKLYPDYQPDAAARFIGLAVVDLANAYSDDPTTGKERGWRIYGARLVEAFAALEADLANTKGLPAPTVAYVKRVAKDGADLAKKIETKGTVNAAMFNSWLRSEAPQSDQVYKGVADSVVKLPEGGN